MLLDCEVFFFLLAAGKWSREHSKSISGLRHLFRGVAKWPRLMTLSEDSRELKVLKSKPKNTVKPAVPSGYGSVFGTVLTWGLCKCLLSTNAGRNDTTIWEGQHPQLTTPLPWVFPNCPDVYHLMRSLISCSLCRFWKLGSERSSHWPRFHGGGRVRSLVFWFPI